MRTGASQRAAERSFAYMERLVTAAMHVAQRVPTEDDYELLVDALSQPEVLESAKAHDPLAAAHVRGLDARKAALEAEGGTWDSDMVAKHLGIGRPAVEKRRRARSLLGLSLGGRRFLYPAWQFTREGTLPGLPEALKALSVDDPWMAAEFFLTGDPRLAQDTPLDRLRKGDAEAVIGAAKGFGEQGAA